MAIDARIPLGVQPLQIQSPMQGAQQALTLRELMAGAAAREAQRDHYRMAQAQAVQQQQAAEAFRAGLAQSGGRMTPELASLGLKAGMSPADLQSVAGMQDWGRPQVKQFVETVGPDGRPVKVGVDAYGRPMGEGFAQPVQLRDRDLGGEVVPVNPYTGQEAGPRVRKTPEQTELERLMIARGIQPGSPQWNSIIGDYLLKKTTHAPAASTTVTNYISPETPGQKKADEKYAEDFIEFATGGYADVVKQLDQLREVSAALGSGQNLTGPIIGSMPNSVLAATNPRALSTKEMVEEVVQRNLRVILGAQFTEKEGERLISRAYNPRLSEAENKARVDRLIQQISEAAKAKLDAALYFQQNGSLVGWKGRLPRMSDFDPEPPKGDTAEGKVTQSEPQSQAFDDMPNPAQYKGQIIRDSTTGSRYQSDGRSWKRIP